MSEQEAKKQKTDEPAAEAAGAAAVGATPAAAAAASSAGAFVAGEASGVKGAAPSTPEEVAAAIKRQVRCAWCSARAPWRELAPCSTLRCALRSTHHACAMHASLARTQRRWPFSWLPHSRSHARTTAGAHVQVEYYFSEANFAKDKFMQAETAKSKEQWVRSYG